jgi:hypothetical protein
MNSDVFLIESVIKWEKDFLCALASFKAGGGHAICNPEMFAKFGVININLAESLVLENAGLRVFLIKNYPNLFNMTFLRDYLLE